MRNKHVAFSLRCLRRGRAGARFRGSTNSCPRGASRDDIRHGGFSQKLREKKRESCLPNSSSWPLFIPHHSALKWMALRQCAQPSSTFYCWMQATLTRRSRTPHINAQTLRRECQIPFKKCQDTKKELCSLHSLVAKELTRLYDIKSESAHRIV